MIFMHIETGCLFELLILSLSDDNNETYKPSGIVAYRIGEFTLMGDFPKGTRAGNYATFHNDFYFVGLI